MAKSGFLSQVVCHDPGWSAIAEISLAALHGQQTSGSLYGVSSETWSATFFSQRMFKQDLSSWSWIQLKIAHILKVYKTLSNQYEIRELCSFCLNENHEVWIHHKQKICHRCKQNIVSRENRVMRFYFQQDNSFWIETKIWEILSLCLHFHENILKEVESKKRVQSQINKL